MRSFESRKKSEGTSCSLCLRGTVGFRCITVECPVASVLQSEGLHGAHSAAERGLVKELRCGPLHATI